MKWLLMAVGTTIGGGIGWWVGALFGLMMAYIFSIVGTAVSFYYCRRFITEHMP
jgi:tetrahydromethanopterin S-methyltransferase subunit G